MSAPMMNQANLVNRDVLVRVAQLPNPRSTRATIPTAVPTQSNKPEGCSVRTVVERYALHHGQTIGKEAAVALAELAGVPDKNGRLHQGWVCGVCCNINWAFRAACNKCSTSRSSLWSSNNVGAPSFPAEHSNLTKEAQVLLSSMVQEGLVVGVKQAAWYVPLCALPPAAQCDALLRMCAVKRLQPSQRNAAAERIVHQQQLLLQPSLPLPLSSVANAGLCVLQSEGVSLTQEARTLLSVQEPLVQDFVVKKLLRVAPNVDASAFVRRIVGEMEELQSLEGSSASSVSSGSSTPPSPSSTIHTPEMSACSTPQGPPSPPVWAPTPVPVQLDPIHICAPFPPVDHDFTPARATVAALGDASPVPAPRA